jgi:hypothetical protein
LQLRLDFDVVEPELEASFGREEELGRRLDSWRLKVALELVERMEMRIAGTERACSGLFPVETLG